jgi:predicted NBD/HSP70 family sugar kinase
MIPTQAVADQAAVARHNRSRLLACLRQDGPTSRAALVRRLQLTKATISVIVDELIRDGLVREVGTVAVAGPGRPPRLIEYVPSVHTVAAVHLGVSRTHVIVADGLGRKVGEAWLPTSRRPLETLDAVGTAVLSIARESCSPAPCSIAVCVPGHVDSALGSCHHAPNLGWRDVPVAAVLATRLDASVHVINDAQAALIAERSTGAASGASDLVLLYAGDGVSAALLNDGNLVSGSTGASGEIGHCPVPGATGRCGCGRRGCLETVASSRAVVANVRAALSEGEPSSLPPRRRVTIEQIIAAADGGDHVAITALEAAGAHLGRACGVLVNLMNPRVVVLAGALCRSGEVFVNAVRQAAGEVALPESWAAVDLRNAAFADDAEVTGVLQVALERVDLLTGDLASA